MTRSDDSGSTRPISVAELLARNGTIGAPPVGGRRRRRRGNADAVTVAELTGEIPVIRDTDTAPPVEEPVAEEAAVEETADEDASAEAEPELRAEDLDEDQDEDQDEAHAEEEALAEEIDEDDEYADAVAADTAQVEQRETPPEDEPAPAAEDDPAAADAEHMSPDPVEVDEDEDDSALLLEDAPDPEDLDAEAALEVDDDTDDTDSDELPSYLRSTSEPPLDGPTLADDVTRTEDDADLVDEEVDEPRQMSSLVHGLWIVGQSIFAVVFGAGLFIAFDQLWKWNNIVALVLSVLVILGLVVAVRVVRKTEDIGSTLIAVAVGALVTLGPLALLQSG
ncbi:hypothetical protein [Mycobacterium sp. SMC-4]|uniref:hypothetical protein n=1 Tax=Mycobacterium sp. SMC-4 TaxID=2857059 RepID=UPI003D0272F3